MKIRPMGAELFYADRQTADMTRLIVAFRNFACNKSILISLIPSGNYTTVHSNIKKICILSAQRVLCPLIFLQYSTSH